MQAIMGCLEVDSSSREKLSHAVGRISSFFMKEHERIKELSSEKVRMPIVFTMLGFMPIPSVPRCALRSERRHPGTVCGPLRERCRCLMKSEEQTVCHSKSWEVGVKTSLGRLWHLPMFITWKNYVCHGCGPIDPQAAQRMCTCRG